MTEQRVAIIGGGLTGISSAIRAAQKGYQVDLFESSPQLGGRTRSFFHAPTQTWVDNGPHLLIGVYQHTKRLLNEVDANQYIQWQDTLTLPLWDKQRGYFALKTSAKLPFSLALMHAVVHMPEHGLTSLPSLLRMAISMKFKQSGSVSDWMQRQNISLQLQQDMIEVLCLGAMNESMETANAASFCQVLREAFAKHEHAKLGWFTRPLTQALIAPLEAYCHTLGIKLHTSSRITKIESENNIHSLHTHQNKHRFDHIIMATSPNIRNKLLGIEQNSETQPICNIHLWFQKRITLHTPFMGGIGTYGQWFFDISQQHHDTTGLSHICAVVSADQSNLSKQQKLVAVMQEIQNITKNNQLQPVHHQIVSIKDATHIVRSQRKPSMPLGIIDACEQPQPGELPATIETAIVRGEKAASELPPIQHLS